MQQCGVCQFEFFYTLERCPHCAHPGNYSNVRITQEAPERAAVSTRYEEECHLAQGRGCLKPLHQFEKHLLKKAKAVASRDLARIERLATSDQQGYATFYDLTETGMVLPDGSAWESLRRPADEILFPGYRDKIRFAALSLDGVGVTNYGPFSLTLRTNLIAHRASLYDGNSVAMLKTERLDKAAGALTGHRACWSDRGKLVVAKLGSRISSATTLAEYADLLLERGRTTSDDRFVEVNIWGGMTIRTVEKVVYSSSHVKAPGKASRMNALRRALSKYKVQLEDRP